MEQPVGIQEKQETLPATQGKVAGQIEIQAGGSGSESTEVKSVSEVQTSEKEMTRGHSRSFSIVLKSRPEGIPSSVLGENFDIVEAAAPTECPEGGLLIAIAHMSVDPYLRYQMKQTFALGQPLSAFVTGRILKTKHADWKEGDLFRASLPLCTVQQVVDCAGFQKLTGILKEDELSMGLGLFGLPGSTAYAALEMMNVTARDRVWISDCCGAVGSVAGQIAKKVKKCDFVMGTCGSHAKCDFAHKLGYDAALSYQVDDLSSEVKDCAPEGLDFFLEMVGGSHLQAAVDNMRQGGRIAIAGAISGYNQAEAGDKLRLDVTLNEMNILFFQLRLEGFKAHDWLYGRKGNFLNDMREWYHQGLVSRQEVVLEGIEQWPKAFCMLFEQGNEEHVGKVVIKI